MAWKINKIKCLYFIWSFSLLICFNFENKICSVIGHHKAKSSDRISSIFSIEENIIGIL